MKSRPARYQPELGTGAAATLRVGSPPQAEIDLASGAPTAARRLVKELCVIGGVDVLAGLGVAPLHGGFEYAD